MMEAVRTSETSVDNHFTRQYNPEDSSEHHTLRHEHLKSHNFKMLKYEGRKTETFGTMVAPQNKTQCLPNVARSLLTTMVNFFVLYEIQFPISVFVSPPPP
jgi:hypothetical protein